VLVSHNFAISDAAGLSLAEGEAAVVAPGRARRGFEIVGRVEAEDWGPLARHSRPPRVTLREYPVFDGAGPHDVAPAGDRAVWFTAQAAGELGRLDPRTGRVRRVPLGAGSAPHGVIVGPDRAAWVTDGGLNAIVRVDGRSLRARRFALPRAGAAANLNTATFDRRGRLWFTGQAGVYGRLDPRSGRMRVFDAPRGAGPYGIATTPAGAVWYASLAGSHVAQIDTDSGQARIAEPPTDGLSTTRAPAAGTSGACPGRTLSLTPSTWTRPTSCGSLTSGPTPSFVSIP
jgi:virginiamycin B lyase